MKQLLALATLLLVVGIGGFMYRNALERPATDTPQVACTEEAKLCPDGTSVARTGPACEFRACAFPNAEDSAIGIAFVVPSGYVANPDPIGPDVTLRAVFDRGDHSISIRRYQIPEGETGEQVILANTTLSPSGLTPKTMRDFKPVLINGQTFNAIVLERFEGHVHSAYYLVRANDVLKFEVLEKDVDWTNTKLVVEELPEHQALLKMLGTLQTTLSPL
tara:strand:+ start:512503 stop:513159 length:657 start_codon:yes stop_codon:yes gene_type:complete